MLLRRTTTWILTLVALLSALATPVSAGVWRCEGRVCGVTLWRCCCEDPSGLCDVRPESGTPSHDSKAGSNSAAVITCDRAECACEMQLMADTSATSIRGVLKSASDAPLLALAPTPVVLYIAPILHELVDHNVETRGPPGTGAAPAIPSLRAPPTA